MDPDSAVLFFIWTETFPLLFFLILASFCAQLKERGRPTTDDRRPKTEDTRQTGERKERIASFVRSFPFTVYLFCSALPPSRLRVFTSSHAPQVSHTTHHVTFVIVSCLFRLTDGGDRVGCV